MHINAIDNSIRRSFAFFSTFIVCMEWQRNVLSELGLHIGLPFLQANTKTSLVSLLAILVYVWYTINRIKVERGNNIYPTSTSNSLKAWSIPMGGQNKRY